jgi:2-polyprenyl-3-methyl-5-hydroxy-6-metoxy-1,4-benzoquinol methylase
VLDIIEAFEVELAAGATRLEREPGDLPLRAWVDLAERLRLRVQLVESRLVFDKLDDAALLKTAGNYSADSAFAQVNKLDDPRFVLDLREALGRVLAAARARDERAHDQPLRILDLGVHRGDELVLLERYMPNASITAVDRDASALDVARSRFPRVQVVEADVMALPDLGAFDLVIAIGLLQAGSLDDRELLRRIVQQHLAPDGAIILGIPNCRYIAGEIEYGARMRNFTQPELGLVIKDVAFYRKYLQQHHRQVFVTGKHYLFVTGITQAE